MTRRKNDFYPTPGWATRILDRERELTIRWARERILEPCAGDGKIARELNALNLGVVTNDIDPSFDNTFKLDASKRENWESFPLCPVVISNPPFCLAEEIVPLAVDFAKRHNEKHGRGWLVAMLLRISFLEPCKGRIQFLQSNPIRHLIVLPRISFTGDGKTDSCTCSWFVWHSGNILKDRQPITIVQPEQYQRTILYPYSFDPA